MAQKYCKQDRIVVTGDLCPICRKASFATAAQGRFILLNAEKSEIGKKVGYPIAGEYAIKVR